MCKSHWTHEIITHVALQRQIFLNFLHRSQTYKLACEDYKFAVESTNIQKVKIAQNPGRIKTCLCRRRRKLLHFQALVFLTLQKNVELLMSLIKCSNTLTPCCILVKVIWLINLKHMQNLEKNKKTSLHTAIRRKDFSSFWFIAKKASKNFKYSQLIKWSSFCARQVILILESN